MLEMITPLIILVVLLTIGGWLTWVERRLLGLWHDR
jgi:NADH:ubiquinone oxidoreductase subunit H